VALANWSQLIASDARGLQANAQARRPRQLLASASRFRRDALSAKRSMATTRTTGGRYARARLLALGAFSQYAATGYQWALTAQARLHNHRAQAIRHAKLATTHSQAGNTLLIQAGKLIS
jgi:hypothetical protein